MDAQLHGRRGRDVQSGVWGMNRGMQTLLLMLAMVASMAVVLLWEASPFARSSHVVLLSPIQSNAEPGSDLEELAKSYDSQPSPQRLPSLENTEGDLTGTDVDNEKKTKASDSDRPERDSSSSEVGTDLPERETTNHPTPVDGQSFTDLPEDVVQQQDMKGIIVNEKEPTTLAEADEEDARSTTDIPTTIPSAESENGTQSTDALDVIAPFESLQRSNEVPFTGAESQETTSVTELQENAALAEKAISKKSSELKPNSTRQLEDRKEPTDTENNTVEKLAGQGSESEKQSVDKIINVDNQLEGNRTSGGAAQLSDEIQLLENVNGSTVAKNLSSAVEDGKEAEVAVGPDDSIREATENLGSAMEDDEAGFKADVISQAKGDHEKKAEVKLCDYTVGKWVLDKTRPLYSGRECTMWLSPDWSCRLHNHPDKQMDRYRWQPAGCNLPVFNASAALETLRNKVVAFVGDSLGRQQWQSLLCMLTRGKNSTAISNAASNFNFYTPRGERRPNGWAHRFDATNTTIIFKWTVTLARVETLNRTNPAVSPNAVHLDRPEKFLSDHLRNLDVVVLNSGHHWNNGKVQQNRYKFYTKGKPVAIKTSVPDAYNQTIHNVVHWIHEKTLNSGKAIYYRSLSPRHFRNGDWNTGGTCDTIRFEEKGKEGMRSGDANAESAVAGTSVKLLNITALSLERGETHVSKYGGGKGGQDCLHWCLPGVPDTWNEILLAELAASSAR